MTSLNKVETGVIVIMNTLLAGCAGGGVGYVYAKLANLPAGRAAQAWAIHISAEAAILSFAMIAINNASVYLMVQAVVIGVAGLIKIASLHYQGLMEDKMIRIALSVRTFLILTSLLGAVAFASEQKS